MNRLKEEREQTYEANACTNSLYGIMPCIGDRVAFRNWGAYAILWDSTCHKEWDDEPSYVATSVFV